MGSILKRIAALGCTLTVIGAAGAYNLETYPAKFVTNGNFDGQIVLGEGAAVADVLGAIDITASLQASSTTKSTPTYHGIVLSGDAKAINGGKLQLRKKPTVTLTSNDIKAFAKGSVSTSRGKTDYNQYLRVGATGLQQMTPNYLEHDDVVRDYLVLADDAPFFEWEIRFPQGLESARESDGTLKDLENKIIGLVGQNSTIVSATIDSDGTNLVLTLMGGSLEDTLREGETKTYTIDDVKYEVTLLFVSDPNMGGTEARFSVNGELTEALSAGQTQTLNDDLQFGVRDILVNSREGVASFFIGARKITITDPTPSTENFDGTVSVDSEEISEGQFQVMGNFNTVNSTYRIAWMKYQYTVDPKDSTTVFIPQNGLLRDHIEAPEGMLSDIDFHYHGILPSETRNLSIFSDGDDQYRMSFFNNDGKKFEFPLISNADSAWKYGDEGDDLVFVEGASGAVHNIGINDYFILSNNRGSLDADKPVTHVLRYVDFDRNALTLEFESQSDQSIFVVPVSSDGIGYLIPGAHTYKVNVSSTTASEPNLSIDLDADGGYGDTVKVVTYGGVIVNLAQTVYLNDSANTTLTAPGISTVVGNGKAISDATDFTSGNGFVQMSAQVMGKKFDTPNTDETFNWTIRQAAGEVDLAFTTEYDGPANTDFANDNTGFILAEDDDHLKGMTDYGILIDYNTDEPGELLLNIPQTQRYTQLFVSVGDVIHGSPPTTERINPIAVGMAILDKDARLGQEHMIVIGGPCVNKVAQELLQTAQCADGFAPGDAFIQSFENNDKIAILVAGYEAADTLRASQALAKYKTSKLTGEKANIPAGGDK